MNSLNAIEVSHLSKKYNIGVKKENSLRSLLSKFLKNTKSSTEEFWALSDISFEIKKGEVVGIIGKNGAGKSTLLKVFSQITKPTKGRLEINGRVASLLEVGTGFHPELTGRENIYLNGTILGLTRKEVKNKFNAIVDFSGVEKFIDTPVKHYSSGMYVRLAFAVAAHLESEILIIDEVLAVGDAEFQKKCLGKMKELAQENDRTVLFVSHNMYTIQNLCSKIIYLENGEIRNIGNTIDILPQYLNSNSDILPYVAYNQFDITQEAGIIRVELVDKLGNLTSNFSIGQPWTIKVYYQIKEPINNFISAVGIINNLDISINTTWSRPQNHQPGIFCTEFTENTIKLAVGSFRIQVGINIGQNNIQHLQDILTLNIVDIVYKIDGNVLKYDSTTGLILNQMECETQKIG